MRCWLNGVAAEQISLADRGLTLGDGHFTTVLVRQGELVLWPLHLQRLVDANRLFGFQDPDWLHLQQCLKQIIADTELGVLRLTFTRGESGRGYQGQWQVPPNWLASLSEFPKQYHQWQQQGIRAQVASQRLSSGGALVGVKTLGRAEQVLLKHELAACDVDELVIADEQQTIIEATAANLFVKMSGQWLTPQLSTSGIAGVMRQHLLDRLPRLGHAVEARPITLSQLPNLEAAFICNSLMSIVPITHLNGRGLDSVSAVAPLQQELPWLG